MQDEMVYKPAMGSHLSHEQAQRYGARIHALALERDSVDAEDVLTDAETAESPLHDYFEWEDSEAAHKYRVNQARYLLRSIVVTVTTNGEEHDARLTYNVIVKDKSTYVPIERVMTDKEIHEQVVEKALRQLRSWQRQYREVQELYHVVDAIQTALAQVPELVAA